MQNVYFQDLTMSKKYTEHNVLDVYLVDNTQQQENVNIKIQRNMKIAN